MAIFIDAPDQVRVVVQPAPAITNVLDDRGTQQVQSDYLVLNPADPAYIRNRPVRANAFTEELEQKLATIAEGAAVNVQADWAETDDTADSYINNRPDFEAFFLADRRKLDGIETGAEVNVNADWLETDPDSDAFIVNRPELPAAIPDDKLLPDFPAEGSRNDKIPKFNGNTLRWEKDAGGSGSGAGEDNVQSDWDVTDNTSDAFIRNKPTLPTRGDAFTLAYEQKLNGIASNAEVNVQSDWNEADSTADSYIQGKPVIPVVPDRAAAFTEILETKLDGIEAGAEVNEQSDWNENNTNSDAHILNKPTIPVIVYLSQDDYDDLVTADTVVATTQYNII